MSSAEAQPGVGVFAAVFGGQNIRVPVGALPGKTRVVRINQGIVRSGRLLLNLGIGPSLDTQRTRLAQHPGGSWAWIGKVADDPDSEVILAGKGSSVSGTVRYQDRLFKLEPVGQGRHLLSEVATSDPFPEMDPIPTPADVAGDTVPAETNADVLAAQLGAGTVVDVMVVYTPSATARYGGTDGIESLITLAVEETNQAYFNSQVDAQLRLVHTAEVAYTESGSMSTDLRNIRGKTDGVMDEVHALRDTFGADMVSLFETFGGYCGIAYQIGSLSPIYEAYAFSVVHTQCATGYYSFGHELGHNMGSAHDHGSASSSLYTYGYGYQDPSRTFRTIMAYNCTNGCTRVQHFSNPYVDYASLPTGVTDWADNALSLDNAIPTIATWRESVAGTPPAAPSSLAAAAVSQEGIDLGWTDNASDESGFRIERSLNGMDFNVVATLAANATSYADTGLASETTYTYRVSAYNGSGHSDWSNDAWATTDFAAIAPPAAPSGLLASVYSPNEIALDWLDNADNETGLELERSLDGGSSWNLVAALTTNSIAYVDQGLIPDTAYDYRVRAIGDGGASGYSNMVTATTDAEPVDPPAAPSGLSAVAWSDTEVSLAWSDNATDESGFEVERSENGSLNWVLIADLAANSSGYLDQGLSAETYYLYRVRAVGNGGGSAYSNEAGATTQAMPAPTCSVSGTFDKVQKREVKFSLFNAGADDLIIQSLFLSWPTAVNRNLRQIKLGKQVILSANIAGSPALIDAWSSTDYQRRLASGITEEFKFRFAKNADRNLGGYTIELSFHNGCRLDLQ